MPTFCANLSTLFTELPLIDRPAAAARAGFEAVEILFPYDTNAAQLGTAIARSGIPLALINCPPPNYTDGPRGFAAMPARQDRFRHDFKRSLRYAGALDVAFIHIMSGVASGDDAFDCMVDNLRWATELAPKQKLTIEPINQTDMPGYYLSDYDLALSIIDAVDAPNLGLQFDAYHAQHITGDLFGTWNKVRDHVTHIQVAGFPERHEPRAAKIDYPEFFRMLDDEGYSGLVSGEYNPVTRTDEGLGWIS